MSKKKGPSLLSMIERERHRVAATITHQDPEWSQPQPNRSVAKMFVIMLAVHILVIAGLIIYDFATGGQKKAVTPSVAATAPLNTGSTSTPPVQAPHSNVAAVDPRSETPAVRTAPVEPLPQPPAVASSATPPLPVVSTPLVANVKPASAPAVTPVKSGMPSLTPDSTTRVALPPAAESKVDGKLGLAMNGSPTTLAQPQLKDATATAAVPSSKPAAGAYQPPSPKAPDVAAAPKPENKAPATRPEAKSDTKKDKNIASAPPAKSSNSSATKSSTSNKSPTIAPAKVKKDTGVTRHTVRRGDTLGSIARRYGVTKEAIARANKIRNPDQVMLDSRLIIPSK